MKETMYELKDNLGNVYFIYASDLNEARKILAEQIRELRR